MLEPDDPLAERRPQAHLLALVQARPCRVVICDLDRPVEPSRRSTHAASRQPHLVSRHVLRVEADHADDVAARALDGHRPEIDSEKRRERRLERARVAVLGLQRKARPVRRDSAEQALGAALRHPTGPFGT